MNRSYLKNIHLLCMVEKKSIIIDLIFVLITGGLWNLWMQYRQIRDYNILNEDTGKNYSFFKWLFFTIITLGLYHIYHEYKITRDIYILSAEDGDVELVALVAGVISATGLWIFVDLYQQELLNRAQE